MATVRIRPVSRIDSPEVENRGGEGPCGEHQHGGGDDQQLGRPAAAADPALQPGQRDQHDDQRDRHRQRRGDRRQCGAAGALK
jgi:hypothetical protein